MEKCLELFRSYLKDIDKFITVFLRNKNFVYINKIRIYLSFLNESVFFSSALNNILIENRWSVHLDRHLKLIEERIAYIEWKKIEIINSVENTGINEYEEDQKVNEASEAFINENLLKKFKHLSNEEVTLMCKNEVDKARSKIYYYTEQYSILEKKLKPSSKKRYSKKKSRNTLLTDSFDKSHRDDI